MQATVVRPTDRVVNLQLRQKWHSESSTGIALDRRDAQHWQKRGLCNQMDPDLWFPEPQDTLGAEYAQALCGDCPVRHKCLQEALENPPAYGVWGGEDFDVERRKYRRKYSTAA